MCGLAGFAYLAAILWHYISLGRPDMIVGHSIGLENRCTKAPLILICKLLFYSEQCCWIHLDNKESAVLWESLGVLAIFALAHFGRRESLRRAHQIVAADQVLLKSGTQNKVSSMIWIWIFGFLNLENCWKKVYGRQECCIGPIQHSWKPLSQDFS